MKNEWIDEEGNIFLIFSRKEAGKKLNLSDKTITKAFRQLSDAKLIYENLDIVKSKNRTRFLVKVKSSSINKK